MLKTIIPRLVISILLGSVTTISLDFDTSSLAQANGGVVSATQLSPQQKKQLSKLLNQGRKLVKAGEYEKALQVYQQAASIDRTNPKIFSGIGYLYASTKNYPEAAKAYEKAVALSPKNADFFYGLGYSLAQMGKDAQAIDTYQQALNLKPNNVESLLALGVLLLRNERYQEVETYYDRIVSSKTPKASTSL